MQHLANSLRPHAGGLMSIEANAAGSDSAPGTSHVAVRNQLHGARYGEVLHERPYRLRDYLRTTRRCKLYDFEGGRWLTYAEADAFLASAPTEPELVDAASPLR